MYIYLNAASMDLVVRGLDLVEQKQKSGPRTTESILAGLDSTTTSTLVKLVSSRPTLRVVSRCARGTVPHTDCACPGFFLVFPHIALVVVDELAPLPPPFLFAVPCPLLCLSSYLVCIPMRSG